MATSPPQAAGKKRKAVSTTPASSSAARKRQKTQFARIIPAQSADAALSATGELDSAAFVKAREYEINALENSMQKSKKGLNMRAFQQVPRVMRRRTASHNVKKVPRRLRRRAKREMKEDNTPTVTSRRRAPSSKMRLRLETAKRLKLLNIHFKTVRSKKKQAKHNSIEKDPQNHVLLSRLPKIKKNKLSEPPKATTKFKQRQIHKTWLPTHMWHAKRAHMTKPSQPLWRMAIPLSPTEKSYRPSHRASGGRGCVAWDVSYMSTVGCAGSDASLDVILKSLGFHGEGWLGPKHKKWKMGTRSSEGWFFETDEDRKAIAPVVIIWCAEQEQTVEPAKPVVVKDDQRGESDLPSPIPPFKPPSTKKTKAPSRRLLIRIHPSAFHQLWLVLLKVSRTQRPQVTIEDLRFEIGSIQVTGPGSTEALIGVFKPAFSSDIPADSPSRIFESLAGVTNAASLPRGSLLGFNICDPRLTHPPKQVKIPTDNASAAALTDCLVSWAPDRSQRFPEIFSHKCRRLASKSLVSQKAINRRKALAPPGQPPIAKETDAKIPILIFASRPPACSSGAQGTWTVLLPWKCVDPVWRSLVYYPLSSGGIPRFGGLDEKQQICFEKDEAWFPGDMPGTAAGMAWERTQSEKRCDEWSRRPPSRRVAWSSVDLGAGRRGEHGRGWACDWEFLLTGKVAEETKGQNVDARDENAEIANGKPESQACDGQRQKTSRKDREKLNEARTNRDNDIAIEQVASWKEKPPADQAKSKGEAATSLIPSAEPNPHQLGSTTLSGPLFTQIVPSMAVPLFKSQDIKKMPLQPSLASIRITLLARGTPKPCARIYGLPPISTPTGRELRKHWLALDPFNITTEGTKKLAKGRFAAQKSNHRGDPRKHTIYHLESLDGIDYEPSESSSAAAAAPPAETSPKTITKQAHSGTLNGGEPPRGEGAEPVPEMAEAAEERNKLMAELMIPLPTTSTTTQSADSKRRPNHHPACPSPEDLIGFVTSGSYNLAEGKGTAIGSIWVQRVVQKWVDDDIATTANSSATANAVAGGGGAALPDDRKKRGLQQQQQQQQQRRSAALAEVRKETRQKKLCVVRNAGEEVGRLAVWELCD